MCVLRGASSLWWAWRALEEGGEGPLPGEGATSAKLPAGKDGMRVCVLRIAFRLWTSRSNSQRALLCCCRPGTPSPSSGISC